MANADYPRGLAIYEDLKHCGTYNIPSGYAQNLFIGDPVVAIATGGDINIATAGTGNPIVGSILAIYDRNGDPMAYWPSGNTGVGTVLVADSPDQYFVAQGDGDTSFLDANDANGNINLVAAAGSTVNNRSGWELDDSETADATAGDQIRLIKPVDRVDNTVAIANADWVVQINNHQRLQGIVGVGV